MNEVRAAQQHTPEQRADRALAFDAAFQNSERMPNFLSEQLRAFYLDTLTPDDFIALLKEVNGTLTADDSQPSEFTDRVSHVEERALSGETSFQIMPAPEDKETLLAYVLEAAQSVDDMAAKTMILGFGINAVHPFKDGNGRTSRVLYTLFNNDYEPGNPALKRAVTDRESAELVLAPSVFSRNINSFLSEQMHSVIRTGNLVQPKVIAAVKDDAFNDLESYDTPRRTTSPDDMQTMINIFADKTIGPIIAHALELKATYRSVRSALKDNGPKQKILYIDMFLTNANDEEIALAYQFYREATATRVKLFVDILAARQYEDMLVAGRSKVNETYSFQEFGKRAASGAMLSGVSLKR